MRLRLAIPLYSVQSLLIDAFLEPLAIVLARRKGLRVGAASTSVKPALVDTTPSRSTAGRQKATTSKARGDARGKVKTEASTAAAVKTEPIESTAIQGTQKLDGDIAKCFRISY